jgi:preprotein translocase subunit SecD
MIEICMMRERLQRPLALSLVTLSLMVCATSSCQRLIAPGDKGGVYLILAVKAEGASVAPAIEQTIKVIENRCDKLGVYCNAERQGAERIKLKVSGSMDSTRLKAILLNQGLELSAVVTPPSPAPVRRYETQAEAETAAGAGADKIVLPYQEERDGADKKFVVLERTPVVTGQQVRSAQAVPERGAGDNYQVAFTLNAEGASRFQSWTRANINNYLAVVLNKEVRNVAYIKSEISDSGVITGRFDRQQAEDVATVLTSGNLPAPLEIVEEGTYKP